MAKKATVIVYDSCEDCPFFSEYDTVLEEPSHCDKVYRELGSIYSMGGIPEWCPLPDAEESEDA